MDPDYDVDALRQALWDIYGTLGGDRDGCERVPAVTPLIESVKELARELREGYDARTDE